MEKRKSKPLDLDIESLSHFELPDEPPELKDPKTVKNCESCNIPFKHGFLHRKNKHKKVCKLCGNVFCTECAPNKVNFPLSFNYDKPKRICSTCLPQLLLSRNRTQSFSVPNIIRRKTVSNLNNFAQEDFQNNMNNNAVIVDNETSVDDDESNNIFVSHGKGKISTNIRIRDYVGKALLWYSGAREGSHFDRSTIARLSARKMKKESVHKVEEIKIQVPYAYPLEPLNLAKYNVETIPPQGTLDNPPPFYELRMRVYYPQEPDPSHLLPVLIWYHGGAFILGDPTDSVVDRTIRKICNRTNIVIVSVAYRLAPEFKFPTQPEDAYQSLLWVKENGEKELCVDTSRIAVGGDSAGGNLAAVVSLMSKDRNGPTICHQLLVYPAVQGADLESESHITYAKGPILTRDLLLWAKTQYITDDNLIYHPYVSPFLAEDLSSLPPTTLIAAYLDPLRDDSEEFAGLLKKAGVITTFTLYKNSAHGFFYADSQESHEAVLEACINLKFYFDYSKLDR